MSECDAILVVHGKTYTVWVTSAVHKELKKADKRMAAAIQENMQLFADGHPLLNTKMANERRCPTGHRAGHQVMIFAFKAYQLRVYGSHVDGFGAGKAFVCTEVATKKKDSADMEQLKRAALKLAPYFAKAEEGAKK
jgi:hypothetical protein